MQNGVFRQIWVRFVSLILMTLLTLLTTYHSQIGAKLEFKEQHDILNNIINDINHIVNDTNVVHNKLYC